MNSQFHRNLNRMALFTALVAAGAILFHDKILQIATANIWLNGIIIGTSVFGIGLCFVDIFKLLPEYRWMKNYFRGNRASLPPRLLKPVATILQHDNTDKTISANTIGNLLDMILVRFEDQRESVRYITNTLIFLGLLGTFWGLINTVGGFGELISGMNFEDADIMTTLQAGLAKPLSGMSTAFTCSLFGLGGSLIVGFLGLQVQMAQNAIFRELEDNLATRTKVSEMDAAAELTKAVQKLERTVAKLG